MYVYSSRYAHISQLMDLAMVEKKAGIQPWIQLINIKTALLVLCGACLEEYVSYVYHLNGY